MVKQMLFKVNEIWGLLRTRNFDNQIDLLLCSVKFFNKQPILKATKINSKNTTIEIVATYVFHRAVTIELETSNRR